MYIRTINLRPQCFVGIDELLLVRRWRTMTWTSYQRLLCVIFQILFIVRIVSQSDSSSSGIHNFLKEQFDIFSIKRPEAVCWLSLELNVRYDEMLSRVPTLRQGQWVVEKQSFLSLLTNLSSVRGGRRGRRGGGDTALENFSNFYLPWIKHQELNICQDHICYSETVQGQINQCQCW